MSDEYADETFEEVVEESDQVPPLQPASSKRNSRASRKASVVTRKGSTTIRAAPSKRVSVIDEEANITTALATSRASRGKASASAADPPPSIREEVKEESVRPSRVRVMVEDNENTPKRIVRKGTGKRPPPAVKEGAPLKEASQEENEDDPALDWKRYYTLFPVANKLLAKKWDDISREKHLAKLAQVKKSVDDRPPRQYVHLKVNLKRAQMEQERQAQIRRNNRILVSKMKDITEQEHVLAGGDVKEHETRVALFDRGNEHSRKQRMETIHQENLAILERLEGSKSDYDREKVHDDSVVHLRHLKNVAAFPHKYIKMIKQETQRKVCSDTCVNGDHAHERHHWHAPYGGRPVPHALEMAAFPGQVVAAYAPTKRGVVKVGVAPVDAAAVGKGVRRTRAIPPISERKGKLEREDSPVQPIQAAGL
ncbi:KIAA1430-like protein-domain-containing protein [Chytriomyces sp. MP71]|nr:KIAA1430-like protein-domain-containing protein [Chytriomyces sp. MP71]